MTAHAGDARAECRGERPLRRDAERNRQRILHAAAEVFTQRGLDATLDDVAREAGVGVGTVYRRFPDKESLVAELFADRIDAMVGVAEQALAAPDPWQALVSYLEYAAETMASSIGMALGPSAGGWVYDHFSAYTWLYIVSLTIGLAAAAVAFAFPAGKRVDVGLRLKPAA